MISSKSRLLSSNVDSVGWCPEVCARTSGAFLRGSMFSGTLLGRRSDALIGLDLAGIMCIFVEEAVLVELGAPNMHSSKGSSLGTSSLFAFPQEFCESEKVELRLRDVLPVRSDPVCDARQFVGNWALGTVGAFPGDIAVSSGFRLSNSNAGPADPE